jgi:hypothetical protein
LRGAGYISLRFLKKPSSKDLCSAASLWLSLAAAMAVKLGPEDDIRVMLEQVLFFALSLPLQRICEKRPVRLRFSELTGL